MTKDIALTERDIKLKQLQLEEIELQASKLEIQKDQMDKSIKGELPMKEARLILRQINLKLEEAEQNIKVLTKQLREKKMVINE